MTEWTPSFSLQDWQDLITHHTTDVESLPSFHHDTFVGDYSPDYSRLLRAPTYPDPFSLRSMRDMRTGRFLYHKEVRGEDEEKGKIKSVRSFTTRPLQAEGDGGPMGSATGSSFWPGGFSDSEEEEEVR